jgi:hypothetical protein
MPSRQSPPASPSLRRVDRLKALRRVIVHPGARGPRRRYKVLPLTRLIFGSECLMPNDDARSSQEIAARYFEMWNTGDVSIATEILSPEWVDLPRHEQLIRPSLRLG